MLRSQNIMLWFRGLLKDFIGWIKALDAAIVLRSQMNKREGVWTAGLDGKVIISSLSNAPTHRPTMLLLWCGCGLQIEAQTNIKLAPPQHQTFSDQHHSNQDQPIKTQDSTWSELYLGITGCQAPIFRLLLKIQGWPIWPPLTFDQTQHIHLLSLCAGFYVVSWSMKLDRQGPHKVFLKK